MTGDDLARAWADLGERIDAAAEYDDVDGFLTRLSLLLAAELDSFERYSTLADEALAAAAHRKDGVAR